MIFDEWYYSDKTLKTAVSLTAVTFFVIAISFGTPNWLQSFPDERVPDPKFVNLGNGILIFYLNTWASKNCPRHHAKSNV